MNICTLTSPKNTLHANFGPLDTRQTLPVYSYIIMSRLQSLSELETKFGEGAGAFRFSCACKNSSASLVHRQVFLKGLSTQRINREMDPLV